MYSGDEERIAADIALLRSILSSTSAAFDDIRPYQEDAINKAELGDPGPLQQMIEGAFCEERLWIAAPDADSSTGRIGVRAILREGFNELVDDRNRRHVHGVACRLHAFMSPERHPHPTGSGTSLRMPPAGTLDPQTVALLSETISRSSSKWNRRTGRRDRLLEAPAPDVRSCSRLLDPPVGVKSMNQWVGPSGFTRRGGPSTRPWHWKGTCRSLLELQPGAVNVSMRLRLYRMMSGVVFGVHRCHGAADGQAHRGRDASLDLSFSAASECQWWWSRRRHHHLREDVLGIRMSQNIGVISGLGRTKRSSELNPTPISASPNKALPREQCCSSYSVSAQSSILPSGDRIDVLRDLNMAIEEGKRHGCGREVGSWQVDAVDILANSSIPVAELDDLLDGGRCHVGDLVARLLAVKRCTGSSSGIHLLDRRTAVYVVVDFFAGSNRPSSRTATHRPNSRRRWVVNVRSPRHLAAAVSNNVLRSPRLLISRRSGR